MQCPRCGKPVPTESDSCPSCGAGLEKAESAGGSGAGAGTHDTMGEEGKPGRGWLLGAMILVLVAAPFVPALFSMIGSPDVEEIPATVGVPGDGAGAGAPPASSGQEASPRNDTEAQVLDLLRRSYDTNLRDQGFARTLTTHVGSLIPGTSETVNLVVPSFSEIAIQGVCDNECRDMELVLHTPQGLIQEADVSTADFPLVLHRTGSDVGQVLEVTMVSCTEGPCFYAVGVYAR